jgi:hypothetical protein
MTLLFTCIDPVLCFSALISIHTFFLLGASDIFDTVAAFTMLYQNNAFRWYAWSLHGEE